MAPLSHQSKQVQLQLVYDSACRYNKHCPNVAKVLCLWAPQLKSLKWKCCLVVLGEQPKCNTNAQQLYKYVPFTQFAH